MMSAPETGCLGARTVPLSSREFVDHVCRSSRHGECLGTDIPRALEVAKFDGDPLVSRSPVAQARFTKVCGDDLRLQSFGRVTRMTGVILRLLQCLGCLRVSECV
jgi:hypothetical protein